MGYNQFIQLQVQTNPASTRTYKIQAATLAWGKFYKNPNKDQEMSADDVNKLTVTGGNPQIVAACGRSDTSSGTEGSIEIWQDATKIGTIHWDNPWLTGKSNSVWADMDPTAKKNGWVISIGVYATSGAAIGYVEALVGQMS